MCLWETSRAGTKHPGNQHGWGCHSNATIFLPCISSRLTARGALPAVSLLTETRVTVNGAWKKKYRVCTSQLQHDAIKPKIVKSGCKVIKTYTDTFTCVTADVMHIPPQGFMLCLQSTSKHGCEQSCLMREWMHFCRICQSTTIHTMSFGELHWM